MHSRNEPVEKPQIHCLAVQGSRLDTRAARALLTEADALFRTSARAVIIDLTGVTYIDSLGIAALGTLLRRAPESVTVVLAAPSEQVLPVLRVTHMHEACAIYATVAAAMSSLQG